MMRFCVPKLADKLRIARGMSAFFCAQTEVRQAPYREHVSSVTSSRALSPRVTPDFSRFFIRRFCLCVSYLASILAHASATFLLLPKMVI